MKPLDKVRTSKGENETSIYDDMLLLIEKGKQQGLKIVVTFEKL